MSEPQEFFILSLKWSRKGEKLLGWWCANNAGYTFRLDGAGKPAGRYTREQVEAKSTYYHDGETTLAVPCDIALAHSIPLRESDSNAIDRVALDDRVVAYGKGHVLKKAAREWRTPTPHKPR